MASIKQGPGITLKITRYIILMFHLLMVFFFSGFADQASAMSQEEAEKISLPMEEKPFTAPSRRIDDILNVLDQPGQFDSKVTERLKTEMSALPPDNLSDDAKFRFYQKRAFAAFDMGHTKQALEDFRNAQKYERKNPDLLHFLAIAEKSNGNFQQSIDLFKQVVQLTNNTKPSTGSYQELVDAYILMGDIETAEKIVQESRVDYNHFRKKGLGITSQMHRIMANISTAKGRYREAEAHLRKALYLQNLPGQKEVHPRPSITARILLSRNLIIQGRYLEGEVEARQTIKEALGLGGIKSELTARTVQNLAVAMIAQGRLNEAEQLNQTAIRILESSGIPDDSNALCTARMFLGNVLSRKGNFTGAMKVYDAAREGMKENRYLYETRFIQNEDLIISLLKTGRWDEALKIISQVYERYKKSFGEKHFRTILMVALRAMAYSGTGNYKEAFRDFSATAPVLMEQGGKREAMNRITRIILDAYADFLAAIYGMPKEKELGVPASEEAFRVISYLGSQKTQTALGESSARAAAAYDPGLSDLVRREQDTRKQITALQDIFSNAIMARPDQQDQQALKTLKNTIDSLSQANTAVITEINKRFPKYADFINPQPVTIATVQKTLRPGEALISIYTGEEKTYIWAVPSQGESGFSVIPLGGKDLTTMVTQLRKALDPDPAPTTMEEVPEFDLNQAYHLYNRLLAPVESAWIKAQNLLVTVTGPLGQLPLSVLPTKPVQLKKEKGDLFAEYREVPWLIRQASVTMIPSANALMTLRSLPAGDPLRKNFVGFGDPIFNKEQMTPDFSERQLASRGAKVQLRAVRNLEKGNLDNNQILSAQLGKLNRLPDTADELKSIAQALRADITNDVFLGKNCSKHRLMSMNLSNRKVIAFATHGLVPGDLDGLDQPALALSTPEITGFKEDGLLTMDEILQLKLNADWVVLSACNTGAAEGQGAEAASGLGKAFFYAGTRALLLTMWPVETTSARKLATGIFQSQEENKTLSRAQALRKSMLNLIDQETLKDASTGKTIATYAHPLFWAPFIISGDGGK